MKANEFRLGNLIELNINDVISDRMPYFGQNIYKIVSILDDSIRIDLGFDSQQRVLLSDPKLKPIPLTEEWLLRFKLTYLQNACWELGSMRIYNISDEGKQRFRITLAGNELVILNYVHQLQNFYWCLTGKELLI